MNDYIEDTKNKIDENKKERTELLNILLRQTIDHFNAMRIHSGTVVTVDGKKGIFIKLYLNESGTVKADIAKIKKDGTPHLGANVYCYRLEDIEELKAGAN